MSERQGIEIDYCPKCRGIWLDRGELDKIIERTQREFGAGPGPAGGQAAHYYEELPVSYVHDSEFGEHERYFLITLEYGPEHAFDDPFNVQRVERNDVKNANQSNFLHPIVRHYSGSTLISEHHVIEDLAAQWLEDVHTQPLLQYFSEAAPAADGRAQVATAGYESTGND